jgi:CTP:molybdopterin cytidylyltransferase MocA
MDIKDVAIVLLAAGNARRFGADKLMADLDGMPLGVRAAAQMGQLGAAAHIAVCQPGAAIAEHYLKLGYTIAENRHAESGLSGSLHLAVEAAAQRRTHQTGRRRSLPPCRRAWAAAPER